MLSRRGRELVTQSTQPQPSVDKKLPNPKSAVQLLDEFIATFTRDRVPLRLLEAQQKINTATKIDQLVEFSSHPYRLVRMAAQDKILQLQGLPPAHRSSDDLTPFFGSATPLFQQSVIMASQGRVAYRSESFDPASHTLHRVSGQLAGHVNNSYEAHTHHLHARRLHDEAIVQADPYRSVPMTNPPVKR